MVGGTDIGDHARVVRLLSARHGRHAVVVRGLKGSRAAAVEAGVRARIELRRGRGDLPSAGEVTTRAAPRRPREDLLRFAYLAYGCDLVPRLAPEHHDAERLFGLLEAWLDRLEQPEPVGPAHRVALEAKALSFAGLRPALDRCARCGLALDAPVAFSVEAGGAVHARCAFGVPIELAWLTRVDRALRTPLRDLDAGLDLRPAWALSDFAQHQLGLGLPSRDTVAAAEAAG